MRAIFAPKLRRIYCPLLRSFFPLFPQLCPDRVNVSACLPACSDTVPGAPHILHPIDGVLWNNRPFKRTMADRGAWDDG